MNARTPVQPAVSPIQAFLDQLHRRYAGDDGGEVASYIPELTRADPNWFGIVIATVDGQVYEVGDSRQPFTIQSISKPLVYGVALEDQGRDRVLQAIGVEPSGEAFNSISLEPGSGRPLNPMINAGAIAASALVGGATPQARMTRVVDAISTYAGRRLSIDEAVYASERDTGHRNRAIGHLLRNYDIVRDDPEDALDRYFRQCSVLVDCRDLALIAATLANGGVQPVTGAQALAPAHVEQVLSVMTTCGVYDFAGEWMCRVGMPAKSGVGGGIMAVLPGQLGVGVFSPRLDARGNSVRGVQACEAISSGLRLHCLHPPRPSASVIRSQYTLAGARSKRRRSAAQTAVLDAHGRDALVLELQGDLRFTAVERLAREITTAMPRVALLDFKRVTRLDETATQMLLALMRQAGLDGPAIVVTRLHDAAMTAAIAEATARCPGAWGSQQPELDLGLEWCEALLLQGHDAERAAGTPTSLAEHRLCVGLPAAELTVLERAVRFSEHAAGELLVRRGAPADRLYFLLSGDVSVVVPLAGGGTRRLATLTAGMGFGENALIDGGVRGADVRADTPVRLASLAATEWVVLQRDHPALAIALLRNLMREVSQTAGRLTAEVAALEG